jgi:hypothetical protein
MRLIKISASSWEEEDFLLYTDLTDDQIMTVIEPIVEVEREYILSDMDYHLNYTFDSYDNEILVVNLNNVYPNNFAKYFDMDTLHTINV